MTHIFKSIFVKYIEFPVVLVIPEGGHLSRKHAGFYDYLITEKFDTSFGRALRSWFIQTKHKEEMNAWG